MTTETQFSPSRRAADRIGLLLGFGLALAAALAGIAVQHASGIAALSPLMLAMIIGIAFANTVGVGATLKPGVKFALRRVLRFAIILLGFQMSLEQFALIGVSGLALVIGLLIATFVFIKLLGRVLGVGRELTELIAAGTSICGASAVAAANTVTRGSEEDVAYAIACVTIFGSLSMLLLPVIGSVLDLGATQYGLWVGASVHEVAQVTGAAFHAGPEAGQVGTLAKLIRVLLLAPVIFSLGYLAARGKRGGAGGAAAPMPWFVLGFVATAAIAVIWPLPEQAMGITTTATTFMLTVALAAMGLDTDIRKLCSKGVRPLALGAAGWAFISVVGLVLVGLI